MSFSKLPRSLSLFSVSCLLLLVWAGPVLGQETTETKLHPRTVELLRQMSRYLDSLKEFGLEAAEGFDDFSDGGLLVRFHDRRRLALRRPDKLRVETDGDTLNRQIWKQGESVGMLDDEAMTYTILEPVPADIGDFLDHIAEAYDIVPPLADLVHPDTFGTFTEGALSSEYLGIHQVNGFAAHHLAFRGEVIDWQLWIEAGAKPIPRKLVIRYKAEEGTPQYTVDILHWQESVSLKDDEFIFRVPAGAERLDPKKVLQPDQNRPPHRDE